MNPKVEIEQAEKDGLAAPLRNLTRVRGCHYGSELVGFPARFERFTVQEALKGYAVKPCMWSDYVGNAYFSIETRKDGFIGSECLAVGCPYSNGFKGDF